MIKEILYKWFGLEDKPCASCELLRSQLESCNFERKELLSRLLDGLHKEEEVVPTTQDLQPIGITRVPWRVRQQMLEKEDHVRAELLKKKEQEIINTRVTELEKELGVEDAVGPSNA